jgi:hypothetical protein
VPKIVGWKCSPGLLPLPRAGRRVGVQKKDANLDGIRVKAHVLSYAVFLLCLLLFRYEGDIHPRQGGGRPVAIALLALNMCDRAATGTEGIVAIRAFSSARAKERSPAYISKVTIISVLCSPSERTQACFFSAAFAGLALALGATLAILLFKGSAGS